MPKIDGRRALALALQRAGFRRDPRAAEAYSLPGQEGMVRVDFGGSRSKSASLQSKRGGAGSTYANVTDTIYFGYMKTESDVDGWARHLHAIASDGPRVPHPPIPQRKVAKPETVARREQKKERTEGRGFYVVNETTGGVMTSGRLAANHGPFQTLDEAVPVAWRQLQDYLDMKFTYLLPVKIVEARSKKDAESGHGHVWWIDGRMRAAPVPVEQERFPFANQARGQNNRTSWKAIAMDFKARAKAEREGGGSIRIDTRVPEVLIVRSTGEERYFQDWQADELIAEMKRDAGKMLDYMSLEDFILAASQSW